MRNKNIFIRKETAFSVLRGSDMPVFANVTGYHDGNVYYAVDYPEPTRKGGWRWHYADSPAYSTANFPASSGTYVKPLEEFLSRFAPDLFDEYASYV